MTNPHAMSFKERLLHTLLFEFGAIIVTALLVLGFGEIELGLATGVSVAISMIAMGWNLLFNWAFDRIFTAPRETRGFGIRLLHTFSFEGGLLLASVPVIAYFLQLSWWHAFWADVGLTVAIMGYTLIFNWIYDNVRLKFLAK